MVPTKTTVYKWFSRFRLGYMCLDDEVPTGRPITAVTDENIVKVEEFVREDRQIFYTLEQGSANVHKFQTGIEQFSFQIIWLYHIRIIDNNFCQNKILTKIVVDILI